MLLALGEGGGELDEMYEFARDKARLDFVSLTDHSEDITEDIWRQMQEKAAEYNSPGRFVTFLGYEWSVSLRGPGEHRNAYYLEDSMPVFRQDKINTPGMLFEALNKRGIEALVIPHHSPLVVA